MQLGLFCLNFRFICNQRHKLQKYTLEAVNMEVLQWEIEGSLIEVEVEAVESSPKHS